VPGPDVPGPDDIGPEDAPPAPVGGPRVGNRGGSRPDGPDRSTPAVAGDGAPAKTHGDPLLAASEGATEGTEGSRHGADHLPPRARW